MFTSAWFRKIHIMLQQTSYIMEKGLPVIRTAQSKGDDNHQKLNISQKKKIYNGQYRVNLDVTNQGDLDAMSNIKLKYIL